MQNEIKFAENVILLDVEFVNNVVGQLKTILEDKLKRNLPQLDLVQWLSYVCLDAGLRGDKNEIQVLLLHKTSEKALDNCYPNSISEIDGKACRDALGEFVFYAANSARIVEKEQLFIDLMTLAIDSADVKRLILLPFHPQYGKNLESKLCKLANDKGGEACKKAAYFFMQSPSEVMPCSTDSVVYSLAQVFGIRPDEL